MSEDSERALFEQWLSQEFPRYNKPRRLTSPHHRAGEYVSIELESMWRAWLASNSTLRLKTGAEP
jgi:hypothetical protein